MVDRQLVSMSQRHVPGILTTDSDLLIYFEKLLSSNAKVSSSFSWISMQSSVALTAESIRVLSSRLHSAGATFLVIPHPECHIFQRQLRQDMALHWVSMTEVCTREILKLHADKVKPLHVEILSTPHTGVYKEKFEAVNFRVSEEISIIRDPHDSIYGVPKSVIEGIRRLEGKKLDLAIPGSYQALCGLKAREAVYERRINLEYPLIWLDPYRFLADVVSDIALGMQEPYFVY
jgi:hypothetical protein